MTMFLSNAYRYLQGQSGLPSVLPARGSVELAKKESRKVRLLCKGLEHFREILYKEPDDKTEVSATVEQDQSSPDLTNTVIGMVADQEPMTPATSGQDQNSLGPTTFVTEVPVNEEPDASAGTAQDQEIPSAMNVVTVTSPDQHPRKYVMTDGEDLFQSLYGTEKTPPTSPGGSVASSSTLMDPSSRKVSPSDSEFHAKGSPIAVKDFAYSSTDSNHVLDPVAVIEEHTKKELLKQLKKKTAAEEKASRKAVKLAARNENLNAELRSANATVQNRDAQADLAKTFANATIISNVVLRQVVQDISHELSHENDGSRIQEPQSQGETAWNQQKEESLKNHLRLMDEFGASAYGRMTRLETPSAERGQALDDVEDQGFIQQQSVSPISDTVVSKKSVSAAEGIFDRQTSEEPQADVVSPESSTSTIRRNQPEFNVKGSEFRPQEKVASFFEKYGVDPVALSGIVNPVTPSIQSDSKKKDIEEFAHVEEARDEVKEQEVFSVTDDKTTGAKVEEENPEEDQTEEDQTEEEQIGNGESPAEETMEQFGANVDWIFTDLQPKASAVSKGQAVVDPIATSPEDSTFGQDDLNESSGEDQLFEADDDSSPSTGKVLVPGTDCGEDAIPQEPMNDAVPTHDYVQGIESVHEGSINENYDFSEPEGPATMWGILQSSQTVGELGPGSDHDEDTATQEPIPAANQNHDHVKDVDSGHEGGINANYEFSEPAGPATLWGILQSSKCEDEAGSFPPTVEEPGPESGSDDDPGVQDPEVQKSATVDTQNDESAQDVDIGHQGGTKGNFELLEAPATLSENLQSDPHKIEEDIHEAAGDEGVDVAEEKTPGGDEVTNVSEVEARGPAVLWGVLKSDREDPGDSSNDEGLVEQAGADGSILVDQVENNGFAGTQDQDDAELVDSSHNGYSLDLKDGAIDFYEVNGSEEEVVALSTTSNASTIEEDTDPSPHGFSNGNDVAIQEVNAQEVAAVEEAMDPVGSNWPKDAVEAVIEPIGGSSLVELEEHEAESGAVEAIPDQDSWERVDMNMVRAVFNKYTFNFAGATAAKKAGRDEEAAQKAVRNERKAAQKAAPANLSQVVHPESMQGSEEVETLEGSTVSGKLKAAGGTSDDYEDQKLHNVAPGGRSSTTPAEGSYAISGAAYALTRTCDAPGTLPLPARAYSLPEPEKFDFLGPVPKPREISKAEKKKAEHKRYKAKKKEEAKLKRRMEKEAVEATETPEALFQCQAEEDANLGDKRMRLQAARQERLEKVASVLGAK